MVKKRKKRNIKLVLQGDHLQLGTILSDEEKEYIEATYGDTFLPLSTPYKKLNFNNHIFTKVLRTTDKVFQACLEVVRYGQEERYTKCLQWLNKRNVPAPKGIPVVTTTNKSVEKINMEELALNPNRLFELRPTISGKYNIKNCPVDEVVYLKEGSPVITLVNSSEGNFSNGSFGYVDQVVVGEGIYINFVASGETHFCTYV